MSRQLAMAVRVGIGAFASFLIVAIVCRVRPEQALIRGLISALIVASATFLATALNDPLSPADERNGTDRSVRDRNTP